MRKILPVLLNTSFVALLLQSSAALAYVPPSFFIVKTMASKHATLKTLRMRSVVTEMQGDRPGVLHFKTVTLFDREAGTLKCYALDDMDQKLYQVEKPLSQLSVVDQLLLNDQPLDVAQVLRGREIPIKLEDELLKLPTEEARRAAENEDLARWQGAPAWVIGPNESGTPQLWIDKDVFVPIRIVFRRLYDNDWADVRFGNYRVTHDISYPRTILYFRKDVSILKDELVELTPNEEQKPEKHPKPARKTEMSGFTAIGDSASGALKDLIQSYYRTVR